MLAIWSQSMWLVPLYALIGAGAATLWAPGVTRLTGPRPSGYVNIATTLIAFLHSVLALIDLWQQPARMVSWTWLQAADLTITIDLQFSALTAGAMALVTGLNVLAQIYAVAYLENDWGWARFYTVVGLFEAGMCGLILCQSLFFSYFLLEILTLCTYLLIGVWYNQSLVVTGARDAFLTKRVGDLVLLVGVVALLPIAGTWNYSELTAWAADTPNSPTLTLIALALIAGPLGKCAQFPLHLWLDEAQEGPLPATILRNAVVVQTGAWVLIQVQPVLEISPLAQATVIGVGVVTTLGASLIAIAQVDIKRALSYVVSAYMGLIFIAVGTDNVSAAYLLLLTYALAMALLVMSVGTIISSNVTQDLRQLGGLWSRRPLPALCFFTGFMGICAVPPLGSFWAFAELAEGLWPEHPLLLLIVVLVNALTAFGLLRMLGLIWGGQPQLMTIRSAEVLWPMVLPMVVLAGVVLHVPQSLSALHLLPSNHYSPIVAGALLGSSSIGILAGAFLYLSPRVAKPITLPIAGVQNLFARDLYTAELYRFTIVALVGLFARLVSWFDRFIVDGFVNLVGFATLLSGESLRYSVSGKLQSYVLTIVVGVALIVVLVCWPFLQVLLQPASAGL